MISGYIPNDILDKAMDLVWFMMQRGQRLDSFTLATVLSACTSVATLEWDLSSPNYSAMAEKVTIMRLKVNLQCEKCYKKVKKVLCKFPQIRDQMFDEKQNIVTIKVVCCSPEKIRDKLCCKGCGAIKSIEIVEPTPPKPPPSKPTEQGPPKPPSTPKPPKQQPSKPPSTPKPPEQQPSKPPSTPKPPEQQPSKPPSTPKPPEQQPSKPPSPPKPPEQQPSQQVVPVPETPPATVPIGMCCVPCYEGRPGGPCFEGCGGPPPCYGGYYFGRPVYDSYGGGRPCYVSRCDQYFNEDNATGCTIM
ncbi:hypothetical protein K1719_004222 [Acacia pycnantha]|nr:hypothetical protein K1719_004222 [Acacia pycnantha]